MKPITHTERVLLLLARLRVAFAVASVAWLLGYSPRSAAGSRWACWWWQCCCWTPWRAPRTTSR